MATECETDRLSELPDNILICNILSHLSLRDVVRTSLLSSRWRSLWKQIPHLDFSFEFFQSLELPLGIGRGWRCNENLEQKVKYFNDIIDNILLLHFGQIERFSIHQCFLEVEILKRLGVEQWIHHAALKEVKSMSLKSTYIKMGIPPSLFSCHLLRDLELHSFRLTQIPAEFDRFRSLQSCSLSDSDDLSDDGLKQLIGLCPVLQKLVLVRCLQLINLKIQAPNLNSLNIAYCRHMESLTADCPQLVELDIKNCHRLIEFTMNSCVFFHDPHTSDVQITKEHPMLNSLRKLSVKACPRVSALTLLNSLHCFRNLEEVHFQVYEEDHSEQERTKDELVADSTFPSLKKAYVDISSGIKNEEEIMLTFLLNNAPSLNNIEVTLPYCPANIHNMEFINRVHDLQQIYENVNIRMEIDEDRLDGNCRKTYYYENDYDDDKITYFDASIEDDHDYE